jgi:hypothetical protein
MQQTNSVIFLNIQSLMNNAAWNALNFQQK